MFATKSYNSDEYYFSAAELYETAYKSYREQNYNESISFLDKFLALEPENADAHYLKGICHQYQLQFHEAAESYFNAITYNPRHHEYYYCYGNVLYELGEYKAAIQNYQMCLSLEPNAEYTFRKALCYMKLQINEYAIKLFTDCIQLNPAHDGYYYYRACCYENLGKIEEAYQDFKQANEKYQDYPPYQEALRRLEN